MEGQLQQTVGENLRRVRRERGLSQERFGDEVGWHRTFVGAVERGERNLTLRSVERISDQLGVHPLDLLWDRAGVAISLGADGAATFRDASASLPPARAAAAADGDPAPARAGRRPRPRRA